MRTGAPVLTSDGNDGTSDRIGKGNVVEGAKPNKNEGALAAYRASLHLMRSNEAEQQRRC
ncbi:hypothetical protein MA16_Dca021724 [Dendrobium catenatum]|uniref:Uncharacterized protein n=1 Tax=Dendrobium catenatum TaxID=906689 RepID=A0A2I0WVE2_9ASPA|nr:hypothetical protein MA16_Dca021724 [Dendrobium catenatum]